jgi:hypothetical protein
MDAPQAHCDQFFRGQAKRPDQYDKLKDEAEGHQDDNESKAIEADDVRRHDTVSPCVEFFHASLSSQTARKDVTAITLHGLPRSGTKRTTRNPQL